MSFTVFVQENLILFAGAVAVLAALITLEFRSFKTRGADLTTAGFTQHINSEATLIDLRSAEEYKIGHITGAKNIPFDELDQHIDKLGDNNQAIALYCNMGVNSGKAVSKLRQAGFDNVKHLKGGMNTWHSEGLPVVA